MSLNEESCQRGVFDFYVDFLKDIVLGRFNLFQKVQAKKIRNGG